MSSINGEDAQRIIHGESPPVEKVPNIRNAAIHGLVEICKGCCRGCSFCMPSTWRIRHKPLGIS